MKITAAFRGRTITWEDGSFTSSDPILLTRVEEVLQGCFPKPKDAFQSIDPSAETPEGALVTMYWIWRGSLRLLEAPEDLREWYEEALRARPRRDYVLGQPKGEKMEALRRLQDTLREDLKNL